MSNVLELQLQHQSSNEYSGLISSRIDWFELLAVQGTLILHKGGNERFCPYKQIGSCKIAQILHLSLFTLFELYFTLFFISDSWLIIWPIWPIELWTPNSRGLTGFSWMSAITLMTWPIISELHGGQLSQDPSVFQTETISSSTPDSWVSLAKI